MDYLEFVSKSESLGHLTTDLIDKISFTQSFYLENGEKYVEMDVELKPDASGKMKINKRNVHFVNEENFGAFEARSKFLGSNL